MRNKICVFIITLLSLCSGLPAQTQPGKLSGVIIDTNDEEILPGANIYIEALKKGVSADKNGEFLIEAPAGRYSVTFSFMGYHTRKEEITIPNTKVKSWLSVWNRKLSHWVKLSSQPKVKPANCASRPCLCQ